MTHQIPPKPAFLQRTNLPQLNLALQYTLQQAPKDLPETTTHLSNGPFEVLFLQRPNGLLARTPRVCLGQLRVEEIHMQSLSSFRSYFVISIDLLLCARGFFKRGADAGATFFVFQFLRDPPPTSMVMNGSPVLLLLLSFAPESPGYYLYSTAKICRPQAAQYVHETAESVKGKKAVMRPQGLREDRGGGFEAAGVASQGQDLEFQHTKKFRPSGLL
ncbi:hypothetical protein NA56DRAFT_664804 [Hyaloscypha hepaticicola]|uniref:Uncharacterized protein n=1 Tax=Hyaloscypha hepaticicola TaxID=2082293 RepID=A0A2J6PJP7_9HELO|nr:hypothetical protein NA56DRAFT_664804 [Hyaloscypha hepaticicola]